MDKRKIEFYVGLFVLVGACCMAYLFIVLGEINFGKQKQYKIYGHFTSVSGLKIGARVEMAGVKIGSVSKIQINHIEYLAKVEFSIAKNFLLTEDSIASIRTSGIIGAKYVDISPGGSDIIIEPGGEIYDTESSIDIESLVRQFIFTNDNSTDK